MRKKRHFSAVLLGWSIALCTSSVAEWQLGAADQVMTTDVLLERPIDVELDPADLDRSLLRIAQASGTNIQADSATLMSLVKNPLPRRLQATSLREGMRSIFQTKGETSWSGPGVRIKAPSEARIPPDLKSDDWMSRSGVWLVRGRVVDEAGRRVSRAMIRVSCWPNVTYAATDAEGRFYSQMPVHGGLTVHAWDELGERQAWVHVPREDGAIVEEPMKLVLRRPRPYIVQVTDATGDPVEGTRVVVLAGGYPVDAPRTDAQGMSLYSAPESMKIDCIMAWKPGVGLEIAGSESGSSNRDKQPDVDFSQPVLLRLTRRASLSIRVVDSRDRPVEGIELVPWMLEDGQRKSRLNFATLRGRGSQKTDADGMVSFDWIPQWQTTPLRFMSWNNRIRTIDLTVDPASAGDQPIKLVRDAFVPVGGTVLTANRKPYPGVTITALGGEQSGGQTITDDAGRYEMLLEPGHSYLIVARCEEIGEVSAPQDGVVVRPDTPIENLNLQLRPGIRLFGSLGTMRMRNGSSSAELRLVSDLEIPAAADAAADQSPPAKPGMYISLDKPNSAGQFQVLVGPGSYEFTPAAGESAIRFVLTDEDEYKLRIPPPPPATPDRPGFARPGRRPD